MWIHFLTKSIPLSSNSSVTMSDEEIRGNNERKDRFTLHFCFRCYLWPCDSRLTFHHRNPSFEIFLCHRLKSKNNGFVRGRPFFNRMNIEHKTFIKFFIGWMNSTLTNKDIVRIQLERKMAKIELISWPCVKSINFCFYDRSLRLSQWR